MFEICSATFEIDGKRLLQPTQLCLAEGQIYGLIGHNGSGKSTLLKLLARQQQTTTGEIRLDNKPLAAWGQREFARQVAYLPQHLPATDSLTGRELVAFGRYPWHGLLGRNGAKDTFAIERAIKLTGTEHLSDRLVDTLSGGERQRLWLAMLLAQGSRFLLLDEPLAALDIAHQVEVLKLIRRLCQELGLGVIIVLHDINQAARYCDRLIAMHTGSLLIEGAPERLMNDTTLEAIYGLPLHVICHPSGTHPMAVVP